MRILLISAAHCIYDARPRFTARQLAALGHDVTLICQRTPDAPDTERLGGARLLRVDFTDMDPLGRARSLGPFAKAAVRALDRLNRGAARRNWPILARTFALAREFWGIAIHAERAVEDEIDGRVDVVHGVGLPALPAAGRVAEIAGAQLVYDAVELERDRNARYAWAFQWLRLGLERTWIRRAAVITVPSDEIGLQLVRDYGVARPTVVYNVAPPINQDTDLDADLRRDLGLGPDTPLAVYIGAGFLDRGIGPAIEAVARLPDYHLAIVGPNPNAFRRRFDRIAARAGAANRIHIVPARHPSEITPYIASANVAVSVVEPACASYAFALPNKLFQPLAARLPVVVGRTPTLRRAVRLAEVGESVDERDADMFAQAIVRQTARRETVEFLARRARFLTAFDAGVATSAWARAYARARLGAQGSSG